MNRFSILDRSLVIAGDRGIQLKDSLDNLHTVEGVFDSNDIEVNSKPKNQTTRYQTNKNEFTMNTSLIESLGVDKKWIVLKGSEEYAITDILSDGFDTTVLYLTKNTGNQLPFTP